MYVGFEPVLFMLLTISDSGELLGADCGTYNPILFCAALRALFAFTQFVFIVYRAVKHCKPCLPAAEAELSGASAKLPYFRRSGNYPRRRIAAVSSNGVCGRRRDGRYKFLCGQLFIACNWAYGEEKPCGKRCRRVCV